MNILLTGPTGFIGLAFLRLAGSRGHRVAGLLLPGEAVPPELPADDRVVWLRGTLDEAPWREVEAFQADVCVHTAWITTPGIYLESPENFHFLEASRRFLHRAVELGTRQLVALGTCIEYQITHQPLSEDTTPVGPTTTYARCKNELRLALEAEARAKGFSFCWTRVFYPYGPREHPSRLCSQLLQQLQRNEPVMLRTPNSTKDYIFIADLAAALLTVVEKHATGIVNLGTGTGVTVREIAELIAAILGKEPLVKVADPTVPDPYPYVVANATKLQALGWRQETRLPDGLRKLMHALAAH